MYAQSDTFSNYLDIYFQQKSQPAISWIHDIGKGQWGAAAGALLLHSAQATELETKHVSSIELQPHSLSVFDIPSRLFSALES